MSGVDPGWRFAGYAALFDRLDRGGDILRSDAFAPLPATVPLLRDHAGAVIGTIETLATDPIGLRVIGRADAPVAVGTGLSFGFRVRASHQGVWRELTAVDLIEVSLVRQPMQPGARVLAVVPPP